MVAPGLIAKKVGMTRVPDENGKMHAVTLIEVAKQKVTKVLTPEKDGYHALQVGFYEKKEHKLNKPDLTRLRKAKIEENFTRFREFRLDAPLEEVSVGTDFTLESIGELTAIDVTGISKGRGFQGAVKRWGAKTGRQTHGSRFHRRPGSLGQRATPGRVYKNKHMPGHMGAVKVTVQNLQVIDVDTDANVLAIKGSVPGHRDGYLIIQPSVKVKS